MLVAAGRAIKGVVNHNSRGSTISAWLLSVVANIGNGKNFEVTEPGKEMNLPFWEYIADPKPTIQCPFPCTFVSI